MISLFAISPIYHHQLMLKALLVKIDKLDRWMRLYRDGKVAPASTRYVIEYLVMLADAERELSTLLNNNKNPF